MEFQSILSGLFSSKLITARDIPSKRILSWMDCSTPQEAIVLSRHNLIKPKDVKKNIKKRWIEIGIHHGYRTGFIRLIKKGFIKFDDLTLGQKNIFFENVSPNSMTGILETKDIPEEFRYLFFKEGVGWARKKREQEAKGN